MSLTDVQRLQIRQVVSQVLGSDARIYALTRNLGPNSRELQVLVAIQYTLEEKLNAEKQLVARLGNPLPGFRTQITVVDAKTPARPEHRKVRMMGVEF